MGEFLKVNEVVSHLDVSPSMVVAEFGCGSADFTLALAKKVSQGRVYALDVQQEKLSALKGKAERYTINNIVPVLCDLEVFKGSTLADNILDIVLIPNVLFQAENKYAIIEEAKRVLKMGGQLLVIDWLKPGPFSPKEGMIRPEEVKIMAEQLSFSLKKEFATGDYHFALLFTK